MRLEYSAGAFVYRKEGTKILMLLLINHSGHIALPKGHIESGETDAIAAKREILEETGIKVRGFLPYFKDRYKYFFSVKGKKIFKTVTLFIAKTDSKKVRISDEHKGYKWLSKEETLKQNHFKNMHKKYEEAFEYIEKYEEISRINSEYEKLHTKHKDWGLSRKFVPGDGPVNAKIMILGQAPGANEDVLGKPFIGRSGKVLDNLLKLAGVDRHKSYITSCVQYFPPQNRIPTKFEVAICREFLLAQIKVIRPKSIIMLGNLACNTILGYDKVRSNHGKMVKKDGIAYFITFHPAMALRSSKVVAKLMESDFKKIGAKVSS